MKPSPKACPNDLYRIFGRLRRIASLVHRINIPVDLKMFIVDKKQNQCAIADAAGGLTVFGVML
ncbi:hypothetical protein CO670_21790 [Rhizobium sp. J15]|uniref:hypothetical protein n=1 Tax=unclassified Rhizobium TaxID=2613769 RepID=UPI000B52BDAA|nr:MULTISPECIES: hypothetical protein [unclassified Rhizobium]OWV72217.1 hypothetical protein ATY77_11920 [Rhizobium sp. R634]PDT14703.1 hypothetical protein CO670_21790 [Rhizobium sp. J15]